MHTNFETLTKYQPLSRSIFDPDRDAKLGPLVDLLFDGADMIHALVNGSALPMPCSWIEDQTPGALPLLDLDGDPQADRVMPVLLPLRRDDAFLLSALTFESPATPRALWASQAVIFIRQSLSTAALYAQIKRNLKAIDQDGKTFYLRFWDQKSLPDLLQAIALEQVGFAGPFPPETTLLLPQDDNEVLKISVHREVNEADGKLIYLTPSLRENLARATERRGSDQLLREIDTDSTASQLLLREANAALLAQGWPLRALPPVLRVIAQYGVPLGQMPAAANAILYHPTMSHVAKARVLEHEATKIFNANVTRDDGERDYWLLP